MRNLSTLLKIAVPVLLAVVVVLLGARHFSQENGLARPNAVAGDTQVKPQLNLVPSCSGELSTTAPAPPQDGSKQHSVTLSWTPSVPVSKLPADAIKGYYVYRSETSKIYVDSDRISSVPLAGTHCADTTVVAKSTYYYVVKAVAQSGAQSVVSKEIKAVIPSP